MRLGLHRPRRRHADLVEPVSQIPLMKTYKRQPAAVFDLIGGMKVRPEAKKLPCPRQERPS